MIETLSPTIETLCQEYVLIQAWKKTSNYIRQHNWYSDTLEIDRAAVNLPEFIRDLSRDLQAPHPWRNVPLRIVPAPKSQHWIVDSTGWRPADRRASSSKLRPLAHVDLRSQVAATAVMMCVANRIETQQCDPRDHSQLVPTVASYGNRLFCDSADSELVHRWGSSKLYRAYYQDYRSFIARPEAVAKSLGDSSHERSIIVHSDLSQFFDRVRPELLHGKLSSRISDISDNKFGALSSQILSWNWDSRDRSQVEEYAKNSQIDSFDSIALPQGLVSAGFFSNVVLMDFDDNMRRFRGDEVIPGVKLFDCVRYVDDLRLVVSANRSLSLEQIETDLYDWVQKVLVMSADGMKVSREKTRASAVNSEERPLIRQSKRMERIQGAISGGFDTAGGVEILDAVQGLMRSQQRFAESRLTGNDWSFSPIPDVRDATVARFAAARYRTTYRSLRPMLDSAQAISTANATTFDDDDLARSRKFRTQEDIDEEVRSFALGLIDTWVTDPANVRLLRIGLDLWPSSEALEEVLQLLRPFVRKGGRRKAPRRVAWYCLAELFRAGATETGFVDDGDSLPKGVDVQAYRNLLWREGVELLNTNGNSLPWYLRQQVLLYLAAASPHFLPIPYRSSGSENKIYTDLIRYLQGDTSGMSSMEVATNAILARRSFSNKNASLTLALTDITSRGFEQIAIRDLSFAIELSDEVPELLEGCSPRLRDDLCLMEPNDRGGEQPLSKVVLESGPLNPLRNELSLLSFARHFLLHVAEKPPGPAVCPVDVFFAFGTNADSCEVASLSIARSRVGPTDSLYLPPGWCAPQEAWRFQLGYLLRFILTACPDFTRTVRDPRWPDGTAIYRPGVNHAFQRTHGFFNGHEAFGDDWLPVSDWTERLLSELLRWPGQRHADGFQFVGSGIHSTIGWLELRIDQIKRLRGTNTGLQMLPLSAPWPVIPEKARPLRACVVQTVIPGSKDFQESDLTCTSPELRKRHRKHLSAALSAVERMLELRETHKGSDGRLDWLILPELSVHPLDIKTHLIPFARAHKTMILAGLTYQELVTGHPLVNSAIWIIPVWDAAHGLQVRVRRQGKFHLAPLEQTFNQAGEVVHGFRPCQWLVGYRWAEGAHDTPLWLTASICYDATDLRLAADLRDRSDVFAIPALNKDVGTFDQMSLALHYHMFQMVIIANNGEFGGSNAYAPYRDPFQRQIFHLHGQPQASIAFLEIDPVLLFQQRKLKGGENLWKSPPAGIG